VRDVKITIMIRPGSRDLVDLFRRFAKGGAVIERHVLRRGILPV
jgi:hypothetical protein